MDQDPKQAAMRSEKAQSWRYFFGGSFFFFGSTWKKSSFAFFAMAKSSNLNESNVRAAMESAVSGLQSALTGVSTVLTQLQMGRPAAEENRIHRAAGLETAERSRSDSIHRPAGCETAERSRSDSDDNFESRPKKRYMILKYYVGTSYMYCVGASSLVTGYRL